MNNNINTSIKTLILITLLTVTTLVYSGVFKSDFISMDDPTYVTNNPYVSRGLTQEGIRWALDFGHNSGPYWMPLTMVSHMVDCQLFGLNASRHHLHNLLLHLINIILIFLFFHTVTGDFRKSLFVSALFALHPLNVESVAWVTGRKNLLSTVFWTGSMLLYVRYLKKKDLFSYTLVFVCYLLGLASKGSVITLIFTFLLLDIWPFYRFVLEKDPSGAVTFRTFDRQSLFVILEKIPFFIVTGLIVYLDMTKASFVHEATSMGTVPMTLRLSNAVAAYLIYVFQIFVPVNLSVHYPFPSYIPVFITIGAASLFTALCILAFMSIKKRPYVFVGWFWFMGNLVMVSGLIQGGLWPSHADRFMYVPEIGLFLILAWGGAELIKERKGMIAAGLFCAFLSILTFNQVRHWKNSISLFTHALAVQPADLVSMVNLAFALDKAGKGEEAIGHYRTILAKYPQYAEAHSNLGVILAEKGHDDEALAEFMAAANLSPKSETAWYNMGLIYEKKSMDDKARECYVKAAEVDPGSFRSRMKAASFFEKDRQYAHAIRFLNEAFALQSGNPVIGCKIADLYVISGDMGEAENILNRMYATFPRTMKVVETFANLMIKKGDLKKAAAVYEKALTDIPDAGLSIGYNLACVYAMDRNSDKSLYYLTMIMERGFDRMDILRSDEQLKNIRETDEYKRLINTHN